MEILKPEELKDETRSKLLKYVYDSYAAGKDIVPADAVNLFDNEESQKAAASVFSVKTDYDDTEEIEKAVSENIKLIKRANLDYIASNAKTIEEIQEALEMKKKLESFELQL